MSTILAPQVLEGSSVIGLASVPPWRLDGLKDLSAGGVCETGYGNGNQTQKTLQYVSNIKHREKYTPYLGWGVAAIPALLDVIPEIVYGENGRTPLAEVPGRAVAVVKEKLGTVSVEQLGFLLSIIPVYHSARFLKNSIWTDAGFDPSGHAMYKISQHGMMLSIATEHGKKLNMNRLIIYYVALTAIADGLMLANTFTNCHTLGEAGVGVGLGAAILATAHLISRYTPLGRWARGIAAVAGEIAGRIGRAIANRQTGVANQMAA